jgi:predicted TIM-barrel fold metal-dependent hydrolase
MKSLSISKSILSISSPGTHLTYPNSKLAATMTRQCNEELSSICHQHPSHFKFFASLPLPSVSDSIAEIDYALDHLGAVGFALMSNSNGVSLGDKSLDPVFSKLNEREAIIFMHPTSCNTLVLHGPTTEMHVVNPLPQFPRPMMEFMFDETRAVSNLLLSGTVERYQNITFIMSHCGCVLPPIVDRVSAFASIVAGGENLGEKFRKLLRERFFFDLAGVPFPDQIHGLLRLLGDGGARRLVYGSDYPFTPDRAATMLARGMDNGCAVMFDSKTRKDIYERNAKRLFGISDGRVKL